MADNVAITAGTGTSIATDDIGGVQYQRVKMTHGPDGSASDVQLGSYVTGTITAANANLLTGAATANSSVQITVPDGHSSWDVYLTGTWSAGTTLHFQGSLDGTNWFALNGRRNAPAVLNSIANTIDSDPVGGPDPGANPSNWRGVIGAVRFFRVTCSPITASDNVSVQIATSSGVGATFLNVGLPPSSNNIGWVQVGTKRTVTYQGRAGSFRQLGIAGTAGQNLFSIFNAAGSTVVVSLESITFDVYQTAARVVAPPVIRLHRISTLPTGGTAVGKVAEDTALTSNASVTLLQGTASDGGAATAIVSTPAAGSILTQEPVARALTLVGYEQFDRGDFLTSGPIMLRAGEGVLFRLDYNTATSNPVTDNYTVNARWIEYTA